jgi:tRNA threonylcarbamoyladenosine biosynthesis protein TsaE
MALSIFLADDAATDQLAVWLAPRLRAGDAVMLRGPLGAGKSHFARALIRARLGRMEDVPSPSFTLMQVYDAGDTEIWHADLYRLSHPDDVLELGLVDAFATAICLVEWPDRLGPMVPADALHLTLSAQGDGRLAQLSGGRPALWAAAVADWPKGLS